MYETLFRIVAAFPIVRFPPAVVKHCNYFTRQTIGQLKSRRVRDAFVGIREGLEGALG